LQSLAWQERLRGLEHLTVRKDGLTVFLRSDSRKPTSSVYFRPHSAETTHEYLPRLVFLPRRRNVVAISREEH
jgi:hypothetical protein